MAKKQTANPNYDVPFNVKIASGEGGFHDMETGLSVHTNQVKTVTVLGTHTRQVLMAGGLVVTDEEATVEVAPAAKAAATTPAATDTGKPKTAREKAAQAKSEQKPAANAGGVPPPNADPAPAGDGEESIEEVLGTK